MQCPHLRPPLSDALLSLHNPLSWACKVCASTDGVWVCLTCGHVGCGRQAKHPELGGGHSRHHHLACSAGHECALDVVSKAVHCYACDDWVICDEPWLAILRGELEDLELQMPAASAAEEGDSGEPQATRSVALPAGSTGLLNLGNTCYMNSVLQALSHCSGFRSFFRDFLRAEAPLQVGMVRIRRQSTEAHKTHAEETEAPESLELVTEIHALLRVLWGSKWKSIAPHAFVQAIWKHGGLFAARRQQDAQEFLGFLLERLDEEVRPKAASVLMEDLFGIEHLQTVTCDGCGAVSKRSENTLGLMLALPQASSAGGATGADEVTGSAAAAAGGGAGRQASSRRRSAAVSSGSAFEGPSVQQCFECLLAAERLEGGERFQCDACGHLCDATRRLSLRRRPQALALSFRRTQWSLQRGVHKDNRPVHFPFEIDVSRLLQPTPSVSAAMPPTSSPNSGRVSGANAPDGNATSTATTDTHPPLSPTTVAPGSNFDEEDRSLYRLVAVVSHAGESAQQGHYVAYGRSAVAEGEGRKRPRRGGSGEWLLFNDAKVTPVTDEAVMAAEAFILLYERQHASAAESAATMPVADEVAEAAAGAASSGVAAEEASMTEASKKARKLKKALRQIEELKVGVGTGRQPTATEAAKLAREDELRAELAALDV